MSLRDDFIMNMEQAIRDFPKQFEYEPTVLRDGVFGKASYFIVSGMGGSHLAADLLQSVRPAMPFTVHADYGFPVVHADMVRETFFIASSYSGNTEEVIDGLEEARRRGFPAAAISVGGRLEELAREYELPFVKIPDTGIQPRSALGFNLLGLLKLMGLDEEIKEVRGLGRVLRTKYNEETGNALSQKLHNATPIIYASHANKAIAYNWKIKCNETGKIPAFYNVFPELNHNEMTGYDSTETTKHLSEKYHFIFLRDTEDDPRIQKRMDVCKELYKKRGLPVTDAPLEGATRWERIFNSLLTADWFAYYTGMAYGVETEHVPMVEEFKKLIT